MNRPILTFALAASLVWPGAGSAQKLELSKDDTVVVRADEAWEEFAGQVAHFRGNFELTAPDWSVVADSAVVYGPLEDPERIIVDGAPARIRLAKSGREDPIEGEGRHIEYRRADDTVSLSGQARLRDGERTLSSALIEYERRGDRVSAGEGVEVLIPAKRQPD